MQLETLVRSELLSIGNVLIGIGVLKPAARLAVLELGADAGADARIEASLGGGAAGAATLGAVGVADTTAGGELDALSVTDVCGTGGVGDQLGRGRNGDWRHNH